MRRKEKLRQYENRRNYDETAFRRLVFQKKLVLWLALLFAAPVILYVANFVLKQRHYVLVSVFLLAFILLPFLVSFEYKILRAREIVLLSMMVSFCVAFNVLCNHTVPLHGGSAVVILTGIALGPETGFLTGALGRFLCNFFDGQGPWTPWQMISWGILGLVSGAAFQKKRLPENTIVMTVYTFLAIFILYGGIMNFAAMLLQTSYVKDSAVSLEALRAMYLAGIPYDVSHGAGAALCVFVFGEPFLQKIRRVQVKYGIYRL